MSAGQFHAVLPRPDAQVLVMALLVVEADIQPLPVVVESHERHGSDQRGIGPLVTHARLDLVFQAPAPRRRHLQSWLRPDVWQDRPVCPDNLPAVGQTRTQVPMCELIRVLTGDGQANLRFAFPRPGLPRKPYARCLGMDVRQRQVAAGQFNRCPTRPAQHQTPQGGLLRERAGPLASLWLAK